MTRGSDKGDVVVDGIEVAEEERQECEVWTRVMGYYRPVSFYNTGKKGEFHERVEFEEPGGLAGEQAELPRDGA